MSFPKMQLFMAGALLILCTRVHRWCPKLNQDDSQWAITGMWRHHPNSLKMPINFAVNHNYEVYFHINEVILLDCQQFSYAWVLRFCATSVSAHSSYFTMGLISFGAHGGSCPLCVEPLNSSKCTKLR